MSRWDTAVQRVVVRRVDPNGRPSRALVVATPLLWGVGVHLLLEASSWGAGIGIGPLLLLIVTASAVGALLAVLDDLDVRRRLGVRLASPLLGLATPTAYLLARSLRAPDPRSGRPLWTGIGLCVPATLLAVVMTIGGYAARSHGL